MFNPSVTSNTFNTNDAVMGSKKDIGEVDNISGIFPMIIYSGKDNLYKYPFRITGYFE